MADEKVRPALEPLQGEGVRPQGGLRSPEGPQGGHRQPGPLGPEEGPVAGGAHKPPGFPQEGVQAHKPGGGCEYNNAMVPGIGNSVLAWKKIRSRGGKENTVFPLPDPEICYMARSLASLISLKSNATCSSLRCFGSGLGRRSLYAFLTGLMSCSPSSS